MIRPIRQRRIIPLMRDAALLTRFVGPLDADILRALWAGRACFKGIMQYLRADALSIAPIDLRQHTAVAQALRRMHERGMVTRVGVRAHYRYTPAWPSESAFVRDHLAALLRGLLDDYPDETRAAWSDAGGGAACSTCNYLRS